MSVNDPIAPLQIEPGWQDVLARSAAVQRRDRRRWITTAILIAALAAIAGPALATSGWLDSMFPGTPVSSDALSGREIQALESLATQGAPTPLSQIDLPAGRLAALRAAGLTGLRYLGATQGIAFYAFDLKDGQHCYDAVRQDIGKIVGGVGCGSTANPFPAPSRPIFDLSIVGADRGQPIHTINLRGIAADGVAAVGVLGSDGQVYGKTQVVGNLFVSDNLPPQADGPIIAYASDGATIWCAYQGGPRFASVRQAAGCPPMPLPTGRWTNPDVTTPHTSP